MNWVYKIGYYQLTKPKEKADDWIIILDESIQLGKDKILLILGIRESEIDFNRPLKYSDLIPLKLISKETWNGELIYELLQNLEDELGNIKYAVGDYGSDLKKGLSLAEIPHIHDITHKIALILEKIYKNDSNYKEFTDQMSKMRSKYSQSDIAYIIPNKQRKKSRYQNIKTISDWGLKALSFLEKNQNHDKNNSSEESTERDIKAIDTLQWLKNYEPTIKELSEMNGVINKVEKEVKSNGLSHKTIGSSKTLLSKLHTTRGMELRKGIIDYFNDTIELLPKVFREFKQILCTSDIIESSFGKYKNYTSNNPMAGVTKLALALPAFTSSLDEEEIKEALETTTFDDIKEWAEKNIGETLFQKRSKALSYT